MALMMMIMTAAQRTEELLWTLSALQVSIVVGKAFKSFTFSPVAVGFYMYYIVLFCIKSLI